MENIKNLLKKYDIRPSKSLGQNFLINQGVFEKILKAAKLSKKDIVVEIGPGTGALTLKMTEKAGEVIAVEKDRKMCELLGREIEADNLEVMNEDVLKIEPEWKSYKLVANLPYYITSAVIRKFLEAPNPPELMVLMIQKEVAKRICKSPPGSLLAVSVQFYARPEIVSYVSKKSFWPVPKVDSAIIKITPLEIKYSKEFVKKFFKIAKAGFSSPRKQLVNNFSKSFKTGKEKTREWLIENGIKPSQRAESLSMDDWKKLAENYIIKK